MKLSFVLSVCCAVLLTGVASADTLFMKAVKDKYNFKIVSCYTCHAKGIGPAGAPVGKEVRNEFGKLFEAPLKGKNVAGQVAAIKQAQGPAKAALQDALTNDFLVALAVVEAMKAEDGKTYGEKFVAGDVEGVKLK